MLAKRFARGFGAILLAAVSCTVLPLALGSAVAGQGWRSAWSRRACGTAADFRVGRDQQVFRLNEARISKTAFLSQGNTQGAPAWYATKGVAIWTRTPLDFSYSLGDGPFRASVPGSSARRYDIPIQMVESPQRQADPAIPSQEPNLGLRELH